MPKEGYESITISDSLNNRIINFVEKSGGVVSNKSQAISQAWQVYEKFFLSEKRVKPVVIGNKFVGHDQPVFVIAEIGLNHNGNMDICKKLIDSAVEVGCDAVKFQKRTIDLVYSKEKLAEPREGPFGSTYGDEKKALEFGEKEYGEIDRYCKEKGIIWFASAWDLKSIEFLEKFNVPCHKIPSALANNKEFLKRIRETGKPVIVSTGMSNMEQIKEAVEILGEDKLIIMHCTSAYPTGENQLDLNVITTLKKYFNCPIGYSGHETGVYPTIIAVSLGACIIERHITLNRSMYGSDHAASLERRGIEIVTKISKSVSTYLGSSEKKVYEAKSSLKSLSKK